MIKAWSSKPGQSRQFWQNIIPIWTGKTIFSMEATLWFECAIKGFVFIIVLFVYKWYWWCNAMGDMEFILAFEFPFEYSILN